jgi:hypothetical protein
MIAKKNPPFGRRSSEVSPLPTRRTRISATRAWSASAAAAQSGGARRFTIGFIVITIEIEVGVMPRPARRSGRKGKMRPEGPYEKK